MLTTIQLYCHLYGWTVKIQNIRSDTILPKKLQPMKLSVPHLQPKSPFGIGLVMT